jgi:hypothetical protein
VFVEGGFGDRCAANETIDADGANSIGRTEFGGGFENALLGTGLALLDRARES